MDNMEFIDDYFNGSPTEVQKQQFEQRIINDVSFAEEVAFYISASKAVQEQLQQEKKQTFRELYGQQKEVPVIKMPYRKILRYMTAAIAVAAILLVTWFLSVEKSSPQQLADRYIQENFQKMGLTMGKADSLQLAISLFNENKLPEALNLFETILKNNPANIEAKKGAGIVSLRQEKYDQALKYFSGIAADSSLYSNYGKFYEAVTLLKRNKEGDKAAAKLLLIEVKNNEKMEGAAEAAEWLKKMDD